jgi:hypothetical protein
MTQRLPTPGQDDGTWGVILNDFLQVSHNNDGTLQTSVVGTGQLQNGAVTSSKLGTVGSPTSGQVLAYNGSSLNWSTLPSNDPPLGGVLSGTASAAQFVSGSISTTAFANGSVTNPILGAGAVGLTNVQNNAITTAKVADGAITSSKLAPGLAGSTTTGLRELLIFYSPPNIINLKYDNNYAAGILSRYDDVVLGAGLQDPGNAYYASTTAIMSAVATLSPDTVIWGYIDCGVTTGNYSLGTLQTQIDQWIAIGAAGIFCDTIGYDFHVSRARQNAIISYIHTKGVGAILNAFNADDVLASTVNATYNPGGTPTVANSTDVLLLESWVCNTDAYASPYYATFSDIKTRGDGAVAYRNSLGIRIFAANIVEQTGRNFSQIQVFHDLAEALARTWRLDGSGVAASDYSSGGADTGLAMPMFSSFKPIQMRPNAPYILNNTWTQVQAPDLGIIVDYDNGNSIFDWSQQ